MNRSRTRLVLESLVLLIAAVALIKMSVAYERPALPKNKPLNMILEPVEASTVMGGSPVEIDQDNWHPPHKVKVWTTTHKGRMFRVIQLPHCEHLETVLSYNPSGETVKQAKERLGGVAACTGSFHNSSSMVLADFFQKKGSLISGAKTGRSFVAIDECGRLCISNDYATFKRKPGVSALALGQRLVPLQRDGFSTAFMNRVTDRMAVGLNDNFIFIIQGKSDIWRLAHFIQNKLPVDSAINCDGGHVVRGKGPVHMVFRWKDPNSDPYVVAKKNTKQGGS